MTSKAQELDRLLMSLDERSMDEFADRLNCCLERARQPDVTRLDLFLTHRCNLRCDYCFLSGSDRDGDMPLGTARRAIDLLIDLSRDSRVLSLVLFGGEPLLRKHMMADTLEYARVACDAKGKSLAVSCTTNGLLLDEHAIEIAGRYGFLYLLSIDGLREVHDRHRRTKGGRPTFDRLMKKLQLLKTYQPWVGARMTVQPEAIFSLAEGLRTLSSMGVNQFLIGLVFEAEWTADQLAAIRDQYEEIVDFYLAARRQGAPIRISWLETDVTQFRNSWGCGAGSRSIAVDAHGNVYPCSRMIKWPKYRMGNIADDAHIDWEIGRQLCDRRVEIRWKCMTCSNADYCGGGCPDGNLVASGTPYYPPEAYCTASKAMASLVLDNHELRALLESDARALAAPSASTCDTEEAMQERDQA